MKKNKYTKPQIDTLLMINETPVLAGSINASSAETTTQALGKETEWDDESEQNQNNGAW